MCATCGCEGHSHSGSDDHVHEHVHGHAHIHEHAHVQARGEHAHIHGHLDSELPTQPRSPLGIEGAILQKNNLRAQANRRWLAARRILALNLVSSPGAGKTTLLERTIADLKGDFTIQVMEGDQATSQDADRIRAAGCAAVQINTGTGCHLDAEMVERGLRELDPPTNALVFMENVGNLVCPALFDLGEYAKVLVASVTEGEDKPLKYPHMFRAARLLLLNKIDLLPHVRFDVDRFTRHAKQVNANLEIIPVSAERGDHSLRWYSWLSEAHVRS
jgi:hydrogenase nickel incorporation protein HypB